MLKNLVELALKRRLVVALLGAILFGAGVFSFVKIPVDAFPDVSSTQVKIILKAPGMSPEEVEARIVIPLELELQGLPSQRGLRSLSKYGVADITIDFDDALDIYKARNMVAEKLALVELPEAVSGGIAPIVTPLSDMFMFTIESADSTNTATDSTTIESTLNKHREIMDWVVRPRLRNIKGVADVNILGHHAQAIIIAPELDDMARLGISISALESALLANLKNDGAGKVNREGESYIIKIESGARGVAALENLPIKTASGWARLGDFAKVEMGQQTRLGLSVKDGERESIQAIVLGLKGANSKEVISQIKSTLAEIERDFGVKFSVFYDRSALTTKAVENVFKTLVEALILIVALLFLFLGDVRAALCVALILPLSLAVAFIAMEYFGISANLMSLGGLVIAIGILVDSAVVVVENAFEKLAHGSKLPKLHVIYRSTKSVAPSVFAGVLVIIIFFVPILTLQGLEGKFFVPLAQSIVFAMLGSLALSLAAVPVASSFILKSAPHKETRFIAWISARYSAALAFCLGHFRAVVFAAVAFLAASLSLFGFVGTSFMPTLEEGTIVLNTETAASISLDEHKAILLEMEREMKAQIPEIEAIVARIGSDEMGLDPSSANQSDLFVALRPKNEWQKGQNLEKIRAKIREIASNFKGMSVVLTQPIDMRISEMLTGARGDLVVKIFGAEIGVLNDLGEKIDTVINSVAGASEVISVPNKGVNYLKITPNKSVMASVGVESAEFSKFLKSAVEGVFVASVPMMGGDLGGKDLESSGAAESSRKVGGVGSKKSAADSADSIESVVVDSTDSADSMESTESMARDSMAATKTTQKGAAIATKSLPVIIRQDDANAMETTRLKALALTSLAGHAVPISSIADIKEVDGPIQINRENAQRFSVVRSNVEKRDLGGFVNEVREKIAEKVALPEGYTITYGGQFENQERANARFGVVIPLSILAIFFVLFFSFRSIPLALLILLNIPFAATGGLLSLFLSGEYMSVPASVGFIALFGIAVLNGVVMVAHFLELLKMGVSLESAVIQGAKRRLRPVLMTASIAGLGLLPMLLSTGVGSEVTRPLAIVVLGGLVTSTALTLLILPGLFRFVVRRFRAVGFF